uniref:single-stranded-DNA-specific exonuclease RecJ n=1 Tax=Prevotella koreensis TaxID=2490854 RepID=UPI0028ECC8B6
MHFKWNYETPSPEQQKATEELAVKLGMSPVLVSLLIKRGITTESAAKRFFRPQLGDLLNPFLMKDMDIAVDRLNDAMGRKERIMVYGDYDVDGCTSVALVYKFLQQFYSNIEYYIPDRYDEGYGVSYKGIDYANENGVKLIIILDCGIKAVDEIAYAKSLGIDFIICDHHVPDDVMPPAVAILNPKRPDDSYPFKHLCGCGVGFKFMQAFAKNNGLPFSRLVPLLDLCAVSIAADIVPVTDENRILAFHGLKQLNQSPNIGLKAIIDICGMGGREISMSDIVFKIGPRINASGRMENGKMSVDLLVEKDIQEALSKA